MLANAYIYNYIFHFDKKMFMNGYLLIQNIMLFSKELAYSQKC